MFVVQNRSDLNLDGMRLLVLVDYSADIDGIGLGYEAAFQNPMAGILSVGGRLY